MDDNALPNVNIPHLKLLQKELEGYNHPMVGIHTAELLRLIAYALDMQETALSQDTVACTQCHKLQHGDIPAGFPVDPMPACKYCGADTARVSERFLHAWCHKHADPLHKAHEEIASEMTERFTTAFHGAVTLISLMDEWQSRRLFDPMIPDRNVVEQWWRKFEATRTAIKIIIQQTKGH